MEKVNCRNKALVAYFLKRGIKPVDMFIGRNDVIVYQYDPEETKEAWDQWNKNSDNENSEVENYGKFTTEKEVFLHSRQLDDVNLRRKTNMSRRSDATVKDSST